MATDSGYYIYRLKNDLTESSPRATNATISTTGDNNTTLGDAAGARETFTSGGTTYTYSGTASTSTTQGFYATSNGESLYFSKSDPGREQSVSRLSDTVGPGGHDYTFCFMADTMIRTPEGEVAVEALRIGDQVVTSERTVAPVRWIGRQTISTLFAAPLKNLPIRIKGSALGDGLPRRDLLVSPDHALLVDGVLVQASALVNGLSILRETQVPAVFTYYHLEMADHSLVLAEGVPAETFVDNVDRRAFDNWEEYEALYGDQPAVAEMNLPRAKSARQVPIATRQRLAAAAAEVSGAAVKAA